MSWVIYLFGSGAVFFLGIGMILLALVTQTFCRRRGMQIIGSLLAFIGLLLAALSATPLPYWVYFVAGVVTVVWLIAERRTQGWLFVRRKWLRSSIVVVWTTALAMELPYHVPPTLDITGTPRNPRFYVIGDSVSAGMGGEKETWPRLLASTRPVQVVDLSRMGATASSALRQAEGLRRDGGLVLVEIGGNDVLGSTSAAKFEDDLGRLLARVRAPGRTVLMFELPLPPFGNEFGLAQRRLASQYGVILIPNRIFAAVLTGDGATLDSVHLAREGHERMAEVVWELIRPAYAE